jgi:hypothetical protein
MESSTIAFYVVIVFSILLVLSLTREIIKRVRKKKANHDN